MTEIARTATAWAEALLRAHSGVIDLLDARAADLLQDGDGVLAAFDLLTSGLRDGWLTAQEVRVAKDLADRSMFGSLSRGVADRAAAHLSMPAP